MPPNAVSPSGFARIGKPVAAALLFALPAFGETPRRLASVESRIEDLLARMSVGEKIGQLCQVAYRDGKRPGLREGVSAGRWGTMIWDPVDPALRNRIQRLAVEGTPNHIPLAFCLDVIHGARTVFPIAPALAGTFDMELVEKVQRVAAQEASASGVNLVFAPMCDLALDPRWGRVAETCGEDPYLSACCVAAQVRGFQGENPSGLPVNRVAACLKHYVGYGASVGGRDYNDAEIGLWALRNMHLPQFRAGISAGALTVMSSFNTVDGVPSAANRFTLTDVLRGEWGFRGFVVSDWGGVGETITWGYAADYADAAALCLGAGNDIDMCSDAFPKGLPEAVRDGRVDARTLDEAVRRVLRVKFALGLFENPYVDETRNERELAKYARYLDFAAEVVAKSAVLLKNRRGILPLEDWSGCRTVALIGPAAVETRDFVGCWVHGGFGSCKRAVKLADELRRALPEGVELVVEKGCAVRSGPGTRVLTDGRVVADGTEAAKDEDASIARAVAAAQKADLVIMALTEASGWTGENGSRRSLGLTGRQQELFDRVAETKKPLVAVVGAGRPLTLPNVWDRADAVLWMWQPGSAAAKGIVRVLTGAAEPGGRLVMSFPHDVSQVPVNYNHPITGRPTRGNYREDGNGRRWGRVNDRFGFGYGLTYSTFAYRQPRIEGNEAVVDLVNTGRRPATETVQLYLRAPACAEGVRPIRELRGFKRVGLAPGEATTVRFSLTAETFAFTDRNGRLKASPGRYRLWLAPEASAGKELTYDWKGEDK